MAASSAAARRSAGSDEERGAPLVSTGRGAAASALTCGREDSERCGFAEGSASDPHKQLAIRRLYIAMGLCGTFMLVRSGPCAASRAAPARGAGWAQLSATPSPVCAG